MEGVASAREGRGGRCRRIEEMEMEYLKARRRLRRTEKR
jgi:hypothetical protein